MLPGLLLVLASAVATAGDPCAVPADATSARYQVVLLVDRSQSMQARPKGIAAARARTEALLDKLASYGDEAVGVTLATFGETLLETWPPGGSGGSARDAREQLEHFFPADPGAYTQQQTCMYRSIYQLAAPRLGVGSPSSDLGAAAAWDFLVFTDDDDTCPKFASERGWLDRNKAALRHRLWPVQVDGVGELSQLGTEYLYAWTAPLQGTVNLTAGRRETIDVTSPPAITLFPRLLGNSELAACPAKAQAAAPEVPFTLLPPSGEPTDEPGWRIEGSVPGELHAFQARWVPSTVQLPAALPEGRYLLAPSAAHLCAALSTMGPGVSFSPLSTGPRCAAASFDVTSLAAVTLSGTSGALDAPLDDLVPSLLGNFDPVTRPLAVATPGSKSVQAVGLSVEVNEGVLVPGDVEICSGGQCGGQLSVQAGGEASPFELRVHPRAQPWTPLAFLGMGEGPPRGDLGVRVCATAPGLAVTCTDCAAQPDSRGCVTVPGRVGFGVHLATVMAGILAAAIALRVKTMPTFHRDFRVGDDDAVRLHSFWARFLGRPLYLVRFGEGLRLRRSKAGAVAAILPGRGAPRACALEIRSLDKGWRFGSRPLDTKPRPHSFGNPGDGLDFEHDTDTGRRIRFERALRGSKH